MHTPKQITASLLVLLSLLLFSGCTTFGKHPKNVSPPRFEITAPDGTIVTQDQMIDAAAKADVVFVGETHTNRAAHHLEYAILKGLLERRKEGEAPSVVLALEMLERDLQVITDEYLSDTITEMHFMAAGRPWGNYMGAYRRTVNLAKESGAPVVASNAPRRYVNLVGRKGRDALSALSPEAKTWLAPLPYGEASETYRAKLKALEKEFRGPESENKKKKSPHGDDTPKASAHPSPHGQAHAKTDQPETPHNDKEKLPDSGIDPDAQALWDATMAWSIAQARQNWPNALVLHINGAFHSEGGLGIPEHLARYSPDAKVVIITIRPKETKVPTDPKPIFKAPGRVLEYEVRTL